eukprot:s718_g12.t1
MKEPYHNYAYLLDVNMPRGIKDARELSLENELFRPLRIRMATPLRFTSWLRLTNALDFATLVQDLHKDDDELLAEARKTLATSTVSIESLDDLKLRVLQSFEIKLGPRKSLDWLNDTARKLLSRLPLGELIVILHLLLPQVTRGDKENYDSNKEDKTGKQVIAAKLYKLEASLTPTARGVHGMHEVDCSFHDPNLSPAAVSECNFNNPWDLYRIAVDKPQTLQRGANAGDVVVMNFSLLPDTAGVTYRGFFIITEQIDRKIRPTDNPLMNSLRACQAEKWKMEYTNAYQQPSAVYELLVGVNDPELCQMNGDGTVTTGTGTRRDDYAVPLGSGTSVGNTIAKDSTSGTAILAWELR